MSATLTRMAKSRVLSLAAPFIFLGLAYLLDRAYAIPQPGCLDPFWLCWFGKLALSGAFALLSFIYIRITFSTQP